MGEMICMTREADLSRHSALRDGGMPTRQNWDSRNSDSLSVLSIA